MNTTRSSSKITGVQFTPGVLTGRARVAGRLFAVVLLLLFAGCESLRKPYPDKQHFTVTVDLPEARAQRPIDAPLRVRRLHIVAPFNRQALVWRVGPDQYDPSFYKVFAAAPDQLLTAQAARYVGTAGPFRTVIDSGSLLHAPYALEGRVLALYGDRTGATPTAVIEAAFLLLDESTGGGEVIHQGIYRAVVELPDDSATALVAGYGAAWGDILAQLTEALDETHRD
jgi:ABC-type uncharacterized transport system auxiliary subunit